MMHFAHRHSPRVLTAFIAPPSLLPLLLSHRYYNDVWLSSTAAKQWTRLTTTAAFVERDNFNAEVTKDGYLVVVGGGSNRNCSVGNEPLNKMRRFVVHTGQ